MPRMPSCLRYALIMQCHRGLHHAAIIVMANLRISDVPSFRYAPQGVHAPSDVPPQVTGGEFVQNKADYGGFLYMERQGTATCSGSRVANHEAVIGGAIFAMDGSTLSWECDLEKNSALVGPAM